MKRLFNALKDAPDFEYVLMDATIPKVHADVPSQKGASSLCHRAIPRQSDDEKSCRH